MIGLVGWGVAVPTLLGAALGIWLAVRHYGWPAVKDGVRRMFGGRGA
jgi:predicted F0F1-ATPase subunit